MQKNLTSRQKNHQKRIERVEKRWLELYKKGFRGEVIMDTLEKEFLFSKNTMYRWLNIAELKKTAIEND